MIEVSEWTRRCPMRALVAFLVLLATPGAAQAAKRSWAERFDSHIRVQADGTLEVTETVRFRFRGDPFRKVYRLIPRRKTDGIEIVSAEMDGQPLTFGKGTGQVEVRPGSPTRVEWKFAPRQNSTNIFVLPLHRPRRRPARDYDVDLPQWRALPASMTTESSQANRIDLSRGAAQSEPRWRPGTSPN